MSHNYVCELPGGAHITPVADRLMLTITLSDQTCLERAVTMPVDYCPACGHQAADEPVSVDPVDMRIARLEARLRDVEQQMDLMIYEPTEIEIGAEIGVEIDGGEF